MQPYQEASQEIRRQGEMPLKLAGKAASLVGSVAGGGLAFSRIAPFLSKYIPENIATKALSKIDPRFGTFINKAMAAGKSFDEIKDFIAEKSGNSEPPKQNRNIIEQYSPELHQLIKEGMQKGLTALQAGAKAVNNPKYRDVIRKMIGDHKTDYYSLLESVYGTQQPTQQASAQGQQQAAGQTAGPGQQALMEIMQKINQKLGG